MKEGVKYRLSREIAMAEKKTSDNLIPDIFECKQIPEKRSPECSGKGYSVGKKEGICSACLTVPRRSVQFIGSETQ